MAYQYGFKFLTPYGTTEYDDKEFVYNLPQMGEKWSQPTVHPEPARGVDGKNCGPGRLHTMNRLDARYAPRGNWWPWFVRYKSDAIIGASDEKTGVTSMQLRRISKRVFWRYIRLGACKKANLREANLCGADLRRANLSEAYLSEADLRWANLRWANLRWADLSEADLREADLSEADLRGANLRWANLRGANLRGADLSEADLSEADLRRANLCGADLSEADLREADLSEADLRWADHNKYTTWPKGFSIEKAQA